MTAIRAPEGYVSHYTKLKSKEEWEQVDLLDWLYAAFCETEEFSLSQELLDAWLDINEQAMTEASLGKTKYKVIPPDAYAVRTEAIQQAMRRNMNCSTWTGQKRIATIKILVWDKNFPASIREAVSAAKKLKTEGWHLVSKFRRNAEEVRARRYEVSKTQKRFESIVGIYRYYGSSRLTSFIEEVTASFYLRKKHAASV